SKPSFARASREWQNFFVNGRPIRSGLLAVMLERPYAGRLPMNRHPLAAIHIELDPQYVDVNVHPRKAEVRFFQERAIYGAVQQAVERALRDFPFLEWNAMGNAAGYATASVPYEWPFANVPDAAVSVPYEWPFANVPESAFGALREAQAEYRAGTWRALGQIHNTYLLAQTSDGFVIVDQHAAQEQIFFERLTARTAQDLTGKNSTSQPSAPITLMPNEAARVNAHVKEYRALGVDIEPFGANTFRVNALPEFVKLSAREALDVLALEHAAYRALEGDALRDKLASKLACVSALKAGDALTLEQQQNLLNELLQIYSPATCPHGRPTFVSVTLAELEQRFLRR
ncbi:MAG: hypothetical protein DCC52_01420, partial [Chloroflexi bacterium]